MTATNPATIGIVHPASRAGVFDPLTAHVVQFYREERSLVDAVAARMRIALARGDSAVIVASKTHRDLFTSGLETSEENLEKAIKDGRFVSLEAREVLSQISIDGMPDAFRFMITVSEIINRAKSAARSQRPHVVVFGEMVALLCAEGNYPAAIHLEKLWNVLAKDQSFSLLCAYPIAEFSDCAQTESFLRICREHSSVIPDESYDALASEDDRRRNVAILQHRLEISEKQRILHESDHQLRLFIDAVQDCAIFMLDALGHVQTWNIGAQRIKGYRAPEIIGRHFSCFYPEEDILGGKPRRALEIASREGRFEDEGWRVRNDGSKFWANVMITAVKDPSGNVIGFGKVTRDFTEKMLARQALEDSQHKLQDSEHSLRQLSRHLLRVQDEERRRIGRDLHDSLGQHLSVLKMKLDSVRMKNDGNTQDDRELSLCSQLVEDAVKEVRTISYLLYPPMLEEMGLRSAILWYLDGFMKRSGIKTTFNVSPNIARLPGEIELALFRVLQESLTNVHRHSGSPVADVNLQIDAGNAVLQVRDAGEGVDISSFQKSGQDVVASLGVGLRGMSERVRQLGGALDFSSNDQGTLVTATVPLPKQEL